MKIKGRGKYQIVDNKLIITSDAKTDYFVNPIDGFTINNAAFVYKSIKGDFVSKAKIELKHKSLFDAGVLLAFQDETHWAKACFEKNDDGDLCICTVMTNELSDDCSGPIIKQDHVWLQLSRTDNIFAVHYSLDGEIWHMTRLANLNLDEELEVGFESQSPTGQGTIVKFSDYSIEDRTLENPRSGK